MNSWRHKWFGFWRESPDFPEAPSILDWVSPNWCSPTEKSRFLKFLDDGVGLSVSTAKYPECLICGRVTDMSFGYMSDGYWIWSNHLIHQVEEHDVRLPDEFAQHIRAQDFLVTPPQVEDEDALADSLDWSMLLHSPIRWRPT